MKKNKSDSKVVHVVWVDSFATSGWVTGHSDSDLKCESVGFYVSEDSDRIKIALNKSHNSSRAYADYIEIPKVSILKRRWVRL